MANGKSTWKYNKLLTARKNYFSGIGPGTNQMDRIRPGYNTRPWFSYIDDVTTPTLSNVPAEQNEAGDGKLTELSDVIAVGRPSMKATPLPEDTSFPYKLDLTRSAAPYGITKTVEDTETPTDKSNFDTKKAVMGGLAVAGTLGAGVQNIINGVKEVRENEKQYARNLRAQTDPSVTGNDSFDRIQEDIKNSAQVVSPTEAQLGKMSKGTVAGNAAKAGLNGLMAGMSTGNWIVGAASAVANAGLSLFGSNKINKEIGKSASRLKQVAANVDAFNNNSKLNRIGNEENRIMSGLNANYAAFGGELNTKGADWTNGLLQVNAGGSHEMNPYEGVPMGMDSKGTPNLVEEGETIFNDYVFSKRLKVPKAIRRKYKLGGKKGVTFAEASKKLAKESEERPNDPISQRGLEAFMEDLAQAQEDLKMRQQMMQMAQMQGLSPEGIMPPEGMGQMPQDLSMEGMAAFGGRLNKFADGGKKDEDVEKEIAKLISLGYTPKEAQVVIGRLGDHSLDDWFTEEEIREIVEDYRKNPSEDDGTPTVVDMMDYYDGPKTTDPVLTPTVLTPESARGEVTDVKVDVPYSYGANAKNNAELYKDWRTFKYLDDYLYDPVTGKYADIYTDQGFKNWLASDEGLAFIREWWSDEKNAPNYYAPKTVKNKKGQSEEIKNSIPELVDLIGDGKDRKGGMYDGQYSDMHKFGLAALSRYKDKTSKFIDEYYLRNFDKKGNFTGTTPITDYWEGVDKNTGEYYLGEHGRYKDRKKVSEAEPVWDDIRQAYIRKHFFEDPISNYDGDHKVLLRGENNETIGDPFLYSRAMEDGSLNGFSPTGESYEDEDGNFVSIYRKDPVPPKRGYMDWARYAPILGSAVSVGLDAAGLTNNPDYSNADTLANYAARSTGQFKPIAYKPLGNYLTYRPFDQQYAINNLNAQASASRRAIMQTAGLNRGAGISGILAADYNNMNQLGELYSKAAQYNEALKKDIETFNRETNDKNSEGMLKADMSNQENRMKGWEVNGNLAYQAADMREKARLAAEQSKSTNFSGLFTNLGNLGMDEYTRRQQDWGLGKGIWGNGSQDYMNYMNQAVAQAIANYNANAGNPSSIDDRPKMKVAKGGKIKRRRKGLTF